jgi:hypothetical protein
MTQANRSGYLEATCVLDAKRLVAIPFRGGLKLGNSMARVWWETFEAAKAAKEHNVIIVELHSKSPSNNYESHFQIVLPDPNHEISIDDKVSSLSMLFFFNFSNPFVVSPIRSFLFEEYSVTTMQFTSAEKRFSKSRTCQTRL